MMPEEVSPLLTLLVTALSAAGSLGLGSYFGAKKAHQLREVAEREREDRERVGLLRLLRSEIEHNSEVSNTAESGGDRPRQVGNPNLSYMKTETWRATRTRATQLISGELLKSLEKYYTPLETLLTLLEFEGTEKSAGERWLRLALAEKLGTERVALDRPSRFTLNTLNAQDEVSKQISAELD